MMKIEIRTKTDATIEGYVNAVLRDSRELHDIRHGRFRESVEPGTFGRAIERAPNIELRFNHDKVLGSTGAGSLTLKEDAIGLYAKAEIHDREVIECGERGELRGWSFGFICNDDIWQEEAGEQKRKLTDIDLREVSILSETPAYIATTIEMRADEDTILERRAQGEAFEVSGSADRAEFGVYDREIEILGL